jgi:hypothetical protein
MKDTFELKGQIWRTVYGNRECLFQDSRGMRYIHEILALTSDQCLGVTDLVSRAPGRGGQVARPEQVPGIVEALTNGDLVHQSAHRPDCILSPRVAIAVQDVLNARQEQLTRAANGAERAELSDEIEKTMTYLKEARSHIRFEDRAKRDRSSVTNAITRAIKVIAEHDPDLARHLRNSIRTGYTCSYQPEKPIAWLLQLAR